MPKKILIATGGTGGHIYPAMALAQQFAKEDSEVLFIGGGLSQNRYFDHSSFDFKTVACGAFISKSPFSLLNAASNISKGIWQSGAIIQKFKPDVVVGFGSYYSFPPLIAAKFFSIPIVLHEANSIPGKVNRLLAPLAIATGVHFPQTLHLLKGKKVEVGMPLRKGFQKGNVDSSYARNYFNLFANRRTLLIFGGSQGANVINHHVLEALKTIKDLNTLQVIHLAGDVSQVQKLKKHYETLGISTCVKPFEERMELAWQAADLVISRAGASSIAEQLEFEVPGILIPFAKAADNHQNHNADFLVQRVGGAKKIQEAELTPQKLSEMLASLLENNGRALETMQVALSDYKRTMRKQDLYSLINQLVYK